MQYQLAPLYCRPWTLNGIPARLIESHYENNYGAALNRLNAISQEIEQFDFTNASHQSLARLKRDEIAALNSTLLHELYFASLGGDGRVLPDALASAIAKDFGSVDRWRQEFVGIAKGLAGGSGWVLLTYVPRDGRLINQIASDHGQSVAGGMPVLALDMYEHAYHLEFGANASAYVAAFMRNIDWSAVKLRYEDAVKVAAPRPLEQKQFADVPSISVEEVREMLTSGTPVQIIDTRPKHYTTKAQDIMEGAVWRDPERLDDWIGSLSKTEPVVTFCVYGFHIGCETAATLRKAGFRRTFCLEGNQRSGEAFRMTVRPMLHPHARRAIIAAALFLLEMNDMSHHAISLESTHIGATPEGWTATLTGSGDPKWTIESDETAPSKSNVLKQSGRATYPLLLKNDTQIKDGFVEVKFKAVAGSQDRAAGIVWRAKDANNYYVTRANALEDNVVLYKTVNGVRSPLDIVGRKGGYGIGIKVPANTWHTLRVDFKGSRFGVSFNGKQLFEVEDSTFTDAGKVGLWTKADSVTSFDQISYGESQ